MSTMNMLLSLVLVFSLANGLLLDTEVDLYNAYANLTQQVQALSAQMVSMGATINRLQSANGGSNYVRWGRTTCSASGTSLIYQGYAAGSLYSETGAAANTLCLPTDPQWNYYEETVLSGGKIYGAEYEFGFHHSNGGASFEGKNLKNEDVPCAVCSTPRPETLMIPARTDCYPGWTKEYSGYLVSGYHTHPAASEYICMDINAEMLAGGHPDQNGKLFYLVEGVCGSLQCPPYVDGRELTCVVCTK